MLLRTATGYLAGPFDVIGIMKNTATGRFHACVWTEHPLPGHEAPDTLVRLKSRMHHTGGAETFEGALLHVAELRKSIDIQDDNVWIAPSQVVERDFVTVGYAEVVIVPNWKAEPRAAAV